MGVPLRWTSIRGGTKSCLRNPLVEVGLQNYFEYGMMRFNEGLPKYLIQLWRLEDKDFDVFG